MAESASFAKGTGRIRPTSCPSQSEFYQDFWRGLESRMGYKSKSNQPLSMPAMVQVIEYIKKDALKAKTAVNASYLWKVGTFLTVCTTASMRGYEGFYLEIAGLMYYQDRGINGEIPEQLNRNAILVEDQYESLPFIVLLLLGKFKGGHTIDRTLSMWPVKLCLVWNPGVGLKDSLRCAHWKVESKSPRLQQRTEN